jgi:hypothetical protein
MKSLMPFSRVVQKAYLATLLVLLAGWGRGLMAQSQTSAEEEVKQAVETMFRGMYEGDSAMVHAVIADRVKMETAGHKDGKSMIHEGSLGRFLEAVGTPHDEVWDERISGLKIMVDDNIATAWMNYSFYRGEEFSHCGVNAMTFFRTDDGWKIVYLIDTRRKENCNE